MTFFSLSLPVVPHCPQDEAELLYKPLRHLPVCPSASSLAACCPAHYVDNTELPVLSTYTISSASTVPSHLAGSCLLLLLFKIQCRQVLPPSGNIFSSLSLSLSTPGWLGYSSCVCLHFNLLHDIIIICFCIFLHSLDCELLEVRDNVLFISLFPILSVELGAQ